MISALIDWIFTCIRCMLLLFDFISSLFQNGPCFKRGVRSMVMFAELLSSGLDIAVISALSK